MEENAALHIIQNSIEALGRGFDVNYDTRLLYCKGVAGSRLTEVDEHTFRDLVISDGLTVPSVSKDFHCSSANEIDGRETIGPFSFDKMAGHFNRKAQLAGTVPIGSFTSAYGFTGSKKSNAMATKSLGMDGKTIPLYKVQLVHQPISLIEEVKHAVPRSWEPSSLASF